MRSRPAHLCVGLLCVAAAMAEAGQAELDELLKDSLGERHWYGVYMLGQKSGYAQAGSDAVKIGERDGVKIWMKLRMKIRLLGQEQDMRVSEEKIFFRTGELHRLSNLITNPGANVEVNAIVQADKLVATMNIAGRPTRKELPLPKNSLLEALAAERLTKPAAKIGDKVTVHEFHPISMKELEGTMTLRERKAFVFNGVPTQVSVIRTRVPALGLTSDALIDPQGVPLEMTVAQAIILRLEPEKQAKDVRYAGDVVRLGLIRLDPPPRNVAATRRFRLQLRGITEPGLLINDPHQQWAKQDDGSYVVDAKVVRVSPADAATLPVDRAKFADELKPTELIQSDAKEIKALAAKIVGGETNAYRATDKLVKWVYRNVKKVGTAAISNAIETLKTRKGDCSEHTVLFVALARAAGIPAREIGGVTAAPRGQGLYYHAWAEVWMGKWVAVDPTFNHTITDATHIKLAKGSAEQQYRIIAFMGGLKAKILEQSTE